MLVIQGYRSLNSAVTDYIAMCKIFSNNTRTGLVFLRDIVLILRAMVSARCGSSEVADTGSTGDLDLGSSKLGIIEKECSLGSTIIYRSVFENIQNTSLD